MKVWRWLRRASLTLQLLCAAAAVAVLVMAKYAKAPAPRPEVYEPPPPEVPEASSLPGEGTLTPLPPGSGPLEKK